ncbi:NADH dehydrogenase subunit [Parasulfuritortus cantonensis]|uniref:NADH dehydrogenase subunit n=2 Tax=Parasulfuritortus cantonensis TaxID=2528202 RepID=A0A4R1BNB6_9PROT|nr:NADH dehydrogenase subunit [Parasulfuritortus cantonensis]
MLVLGDWRRAGVLATLMYGVQLALLFTMQRTGSTSFDLSALGFELSWRFDALSWFFAVVTLGTAFFASWYGAGEWLRAYTGRRRLFQSALAANVFAMLLLLGSGDLLTLFVGWEATSWAGFLLMALAGGLARDAALRYLVYAMAGAMALLGALVVLFQAGGSFSYEAARATLAAMAPGPLWALIILFGLGFGAKLALLPLHLWQAAAYSETPAPGSVFLGGVVGRMGLFALALVLVGLIGIPHLQALAVPFTFLTAQDVVAWVAALTVVLPTYTALKQNDARYLLAWHGIGQGGYMLLGLIVGSALGSAGGLLHVINYAATQATLLMVVFGVRHRVGHTDLNRLGGLVARMPLSFLALLLGIISLAGLPPMSGFVSKWMVYSSLIQDGRPFLFLAAIVGTLGTILSVYKLIHNLFLGQLRAEHEQLNEAPLSMLIPMLATATLAFVTGVAPGLVLGWVADAQAAIGLPVIDYTLGGIASPRASLDMLWVVGVMFAGFGVGALLFYGAGGKTHRVHQLDNYAGGHFLDAGMRYHYSDNFYAGLMHLIGGWYRGSFHWLEGAIGSGLSLVAQGAGGWYRAINPAFYLLAASVALIAWVAL